MSSRFVFRFAVSMCIACIASTTLAQSPTTKPIPAVEHVIVISIDGCRPDVLLKSNTPALHELFHRGSFSFWAQTVPIAITLPSHVSMLTGVSVERHGINFNDERATTRPIYPNAVTLFEVAHAHGLTTALVSGKSKFEALAKPGTVDWLALPDEAKTSDEFVVENASAVITQHRPQVMFIHFPGADTAGHAKGWDSPEQIAAIEKIDRGIGDIVTTLQNEKLLDSTVIIVSADHGGSGRTHGAGDVRSLCIPWIAAGPGVRKNFDLTLLRDLTVNTTDTFATACFLMGMQPPDGIDGKPIYQIVEGYELMRDDKAKSFKVVAKPATTRSSP